MVRGVRDATLWLGLLGPPTIWLGALTANYGFAYPACRAGDRWLLFVTPAITIALIAVMAFFVWRSSKETAVEGDSSRVGFMARMGLYNCAGFIVTTCAMFLPALLNHPCDL